MKSQCYSRALVALIFILLFSSLFLSAIADGAGDDATNDRIELTFSFGWAGYKLDDINERYVNGLAKPLGLLKDDIPNGLDYQIEMSYRLFKNYSFGIGYILLTSDSKYKEAFDWAMTDAGGFDMYRDKIYFDRKARASMRGITFNARRYFDISFIHFAATAGAAWLHGKTELSSNVSIPDNPRTPENEGRVFDDKVSYTDNTPGYWSSLGMVLPLNSRLGLVFEGGYRQFKTGELKDSDGNVWTTNDGNPEGIRLDMSGAFFLSSVRISF